MHILKSIFFSLLILTSKNVFAMMFATYSCNFHSDENENWVLDFASSSEHMSTTGWNQVNPIYSSLYGKDESGFLGVCSYLLSESPDQIAFKTYIIRGRDLDLYDGDGCMYSGAIDEVEKRVKEVHTNTDFQSVAYNIFAGDSKQRKLLISGLSPDPSDDPIKFCANALKRATGLADADFSHSQQVIEHVKVKLGKVTRKLKL